MSVKIIASYWIPLLTSRCCDSDPASNLTEFMNGKATNFRYKYGCEEHLIGAYLTYAR